MQKILILGSSGLLGRQLYENLKRNKNIKLFHSGLKKRKINLANKTLLKKFLVLKNPDLIINCIGYTNIEKCEKSEKTSKIFNVIIVKEIFKIKFKEKLKFKFIHFSTDQFYNKKKQKSSKENSKIFLMNNYCKHKRMAEIICMKNKALVFRTNFFGKTLGKNNSFSDWIYNVFKKKKKVFLFDDVYFNPLSINTFAKIIALIVSERKFKINGIYNLGAKDAIYKNKFAILFAKKINVFHSNYVYINVNKLLNVKRSNNMFMNTKKFEQKFKIMLPNINKEIRNEAKKYY